jgi:hypothetical protein
MRKMSAGPKTIEEIVNDMIPYGPLGVHQRKAGAHITRLRDAHHRLAQLEARGIPDRLICRECGYTYERLRRIRNSPAYINLVANYKLSMDPKQMEGQDTYVELRLRGMILAQRMLIERLEAADAGDEDVTVSLKELLAITSDAADRFGYPKQSLSLQGGAEEFSAALDRAIARSGTRQVERASDAPGEVSLPSPVPPADVLVIEGVALPASQEQPSGKVERSPTHPLRSAAAPVSNFRRRR